MRNDGEWTLDAIVATDERHRVTLVLGGGRLPESWLLLLDSPIQLDALGNFGPADTGLLPDRSGIQRLAVARDEDGDVAPASVTDAFAVVDALVFATRKPLAVPRLLTSIAQFLGVVGAGNLGAHPAVLGVPDARAPREASPDAMWRTPFLDAVIDGDSTIVLRADEERPSVVRLEGAQARSWAAAEGLDLDGTAARAGGGVDMGDVSSLRLSVRALQEKGLLASTPSWRRHPQSAWIDGGSSATVVSARGPLETPLLLSGSAFAVWTRLCVAQAVRMEDLVESVAADYGVEVEEVMSDVRVLLEQLRDHAAVVHV